MSFHIKNSVQFGVKRIAVHQLKETARDCVKLDLVTHTYIRRRIVVVVTDRHLEVCQHKMSAISNRGSKACATLSDPAEQKLQ